MTSSKEKPINTGVKAMIHDGRSPSGCQGRMTMSHLLISVRTDRGADGKHVGTHQSLPDIRESPVERDAARPTFRKLRA